MDADAGTMKSSDSRMRIVDFELMKNTINIDKLMKRFMVEINSILQFISDTYQDILKQRIDILSKFIELKFFFAPRNSPHLPA